MARNTSPISVTKGFLGKIKDLSGLNFGSFDLKSGISKQVANLKRSVLKDFFVFVTIISLGFGFLALLFTFIIAIVIITNSSAFVTPSAPSLIAFFNPEGGFLNPTSCPLDNGVITLGSYNPTHENDRAGGHGSTYYWDDVYGGSCYTTPQETNCNSSPFPAGNRCNYSGHADPCEEYGFSADVFGGPAGTAVIVPLLDGESANWTCRYAWTTGGGDTVFCDTGDHGGAHLTYTHVVSAPGFSIGPVISGTIVTHLFDQGSNTHLHFEARLGSDWVRPENNFCGSLVAP